MKSTTARTFVAGVLGFGLCTACLADFDKAGKIDALFSQWNQADSPGAAIVVLEAGAIVYERGYGYANLQHHIRITPQTLFDCASVAKQFTGLSLAMLIQEGKLSLDDDIRRYLPDMPDFGRPITIGNLVYHTSGLRDWPETLGISGVDMEAPIRLEMILEMVRRQRELDFMPGEEHAYSNTGYNLLAAAIAKVTGESFRSWTHKNLFEPLGMNRTQVCDDPGEVVIDFAESYSPAGSSKFRRVTSQLAAQGSSSLFISAEDMGHWLLNFENQKVGGKTAIELMQRRGKLNRGGKVDYGFGLSLGAFEAMPMVSHSGSWAGYRSMVLRIPEKHFAVAVLSNVSNMNTWDIAAKIAGICLNLVQPSGTVTNLVYRGINAPKLTLPELTRARFAVYTGDYWSEELRDLARVEVHEGKLGIRLRSGSWLDLLPSGRDRFDTIAGIVIEFTCGAESRASEAKISGSRVRNLRYTRVALQ